jgi:hypothetical protein
LRRKRVRTFFNIEILQNSIKRAILKQKIKSFGNGVTPKGAVGQLKAMGK